MKNPDKNKLRALALLSAVTGATLIASGAAQADPPRWSCEDATPGGSSYDGSRCSYDALPLGPPVPAINIPRPSPGPPYSS